MKRLIALIVLPGCLLLGGKATAEVSKSELLAKYEPAAKKLRQFYSELTISAQMSTEKVADPNFTYPDRLTFLARGERWRLDTSFAPSGSQAPDTVIARAIVAEPQASFTMVKRAGTDSFRPDRITLELGAARENIRNLAPFVAAPYTINDTTVEEFLKDSRLTITSTQEETRGSEQLLKVHYQIDTIADNQPWQYSGWCLFSTSQLWALRGYLFRATAVESGQSWAEINYQGSSEGVPLLKTAEYWMQSGSDRSEIRRFVITDITPGAPEADQFTPAAVQPPPRRSFFPPYFLPAAAVVALLIAAAAWFILRAKRSQRQG